MSPESSRDIAPPPSSSPAPVRESQPQIDSPTTTAHGTERHNALFDTPPPGTQAPELKRSDRSRNISSRGRDTVATTGKPLAGHSQVEPSQVKPAPAKPRAASAPRSTSDRQTTKKPIKRPLRFDNESSDNEARTRTRPAVHQGTHDDSPPPKRPGSASSVARGGGRTIKQSIRIDADAARSLGKLLGVDTGTATASAINETIKSLADTHAPQMGSSQRYSQVRSEAAAPLSPLKKKGGGYYRDKLLALAHPRSLKRPASNTEAGSSKCPRADNQEYGDVVMADPIPTPPPLPSFLEHKLPSVSSTQRAVVNAFESQREQTRATHATDRVRFGAGATPIPQPKDYFSRLLPRSPSPVHRAITPESQAVPRVPLALAHASLSPSPTPEPRPPKPTIIQASRRPQILVPASPSPSPTPEPRPAKPTITEASHGRRTRTPASASSPIPKPRHAQPVTTQASRADQPKRPWRQNIDTATEPETEPEFMLQPKPKKHTRPHHDGRSGHRSSRPGTALSTHRPRHSPPHRKSGTASNGQHDTKSILKRLGKALDGDSSDEGNNSTLDWAVKLLQQRRRRHGNAHHSSSSRHRPTHSSSRSQPGPSTSHYARHPRTPDEDLSDSPPHSRHSTPADDSDSPVDVTRSGLAKYPGTRGKVASRAIPKLLSTATCQGIFQEHDTYIKWARNAYRRAWAQYYPHVPYKDPPLDLLRTIVLRISGLRTEVKKRIRALIQYLFKFDNPGSSKRLRAANRKLFEKLYPNAFHCRDLETDEDQYEHPIFIKAIIIAFFWHRDSFAIQNHKHFKVIPLPAVAFVLTMMQDCIGEWQTGEFCSRENSVRIQREMFDAHLHGLHEYRKSAGSRLERFQGKWFELGMKHAGIQINIPVGEKRFCQPVTLARNVRPDTPEESEPEYDENGRLTARSKGKAKAKAPPSGDDLDEE